MSQLKPLPLTASKICKFMEVPLPLAHWCLVTEAAVQLGYAAPLKMESGHLIRAAREERGILREAYFLSL